MKVEVVDMTRVEVLDKLLTSLSDLASVKKVDEWELAYHVSEMAFLVDGSHLPVEDLVYGSIEMVEDLIDLYAEGGV